MLTYKKPRAKILSFALTAAMVATMLPTTMFAAQDGNIAPNVSLVGEIQSFDKLEDRFIPSVGYEASSNIYGLTVKEGTSLEELNLPTQLTAMVTRTTVVTAPPVEEDTVDSSQPTEPIIPSEDKNEDVVIDNGLVSTLEEVSLASQPAQDSVITTTENESIPVKWNSDRNYTSEKSNTPFIFTAELPQDFTLASGVELPQIYVYVDAQKSRAASLDRIVVGGTNATSGYEYPYYEGDTSNADQRAVAINKAFTDIATGGTIVLGTDIKKVKLSGDVRSAKNVTLDLNGFELCSMLDSDDGDSIKVSGSAVFTLIDSSPSKSGVLASNGDAYLIKNSGGTVNVTGSTIEARVSGGTAIANQDTNLVITDATVRSVSAGLIRSVYNSNGSVTITNSTIEAGEDGSIAIVNYGDDGTIDISGGTVENKGDGAPTIRNSSNGTIKLRDGAKVIGSVDKSNSEGTIFMASNPTTAKILLDIQDTSEVSNISSSTPGAYSVYFDTVPYVDLNKYYSEASTATVGNVYPEGPVATIGATEYKTLQEAFDAAVTAGGPITIVMQKKVTSGNVSLPNITKQTTVTLDLNGFNVSLAGDETNSGIYFNGSSTNYLDLTVTDSHTDVTKRGKLTVVGGTNADNFYGDSAIHNTYGPITIDGIAVDASANGRAIYSYAGLTLKNANVTASSTGSDTLYIRKPTTITGGTLTVTNSSTATRGIYGLYSSGLTINGDATVNITCKSATRSHAVYSYDSINIEADADGKSPTIALEGKLYGMLAKEAINVSAGTITSKALAPREGLDVPSGIGIGAKTITFSGGMITGTGFEKGIAASQSITATDATVRCNLSGNTTYTDTAHIGNPDKINIYEGAVGTDTNVANDVRISFGPVVTVGAQTGTLTYGDTTGATFAVTTTNFKNPISTNDYTLIGLLLPTEQLQQLLPQG